jgi:hypothetical protein
MRRKTCEPDGDEPAYEPGPSERPVLETYLQSVAAALPRIKVLDGKTAIAPDHPDPAVGQVLLMAALGTADHDFFAGIVGQLGDATSQDGKVDEQALNFMLSVVKGIKPRDQVETMLAAQMAAVHVATLTCARRLAQAETVAQQDCAERAVNKLARTFATQVEALKRYRSGGESNVTVQHVSVSDGGQAIVGHVTQGPHAVPPRETASHNTAPRAAPAAASRVAVPDAALPKRPATLPPPAEAPMPLLSHPEITPRSMLRAR